MASGTPWLESFRYTFQSEKEGFKRVCKFGERGSPWRDLPLEERLSCFLHSAQFIQGFLFARYLSLAARFHLPSLPSTRSP